VLPVELFCMQADCVEEPFDEVPAAVPLLVGVELVPVEEVVPVVPVCVELPCVEELVELLVVELSCVVCVQRSDVALVCELS
jgi:hypothetical protein